MTPTRPPPTLETSAGRVRGTRAAGVLAFLGIPYAASPEGAARFRPPAPPAAWAGVRDGTVPAPWAPQNPAGRGMPPTEAAPQAEDCLTVSVWTPALDGGRRPVLVWLHGGGFVAGGASSRWSRGDLLAARADAVVVAVTYRMGLLGFAAHEELRDPDSGAAANWGLLDQLAALRWVREHAAALGGDPDQVTLAGHSAGAISVCDLLASGAAAGLVARAVALSGAPSARPLERAAATLDRVVRRLGLASVTQLRERPVADLLAAQRDLAAGGDPYATRPAVDGGLLRRHPLRSFLAGEHTAVPLVLGTTREEVRAFYAGSPVLARMSRSVLHGRLTRDLGRERAEDVLDGYAAARAARGEGVSPGELLVAVDTDRILRVPAMRVAAANAGRQRASYAYRVDLGGGADGPGAGHGVDLPLLFSDPDRPAPNPYWDWTPQRARLAAAVQDALTSWLLGGPPSPDWPCYDAGVRATAVVSETCRVVEAPEEPERALWRDEELES
jgi:para-nitrobenzyl esterase